MITIIYIFLTINLIYWIFIFSKVSFYNSPFFRKEQATAKIDETIVIIAAKNEQENLEKNLGTILKQDAKGFSVLVVDDHSSDNTLNILKKLQNIYPHLYVLKNIEDKGKKHALSFAIRHTDKKYLLFTDADCYLYSKNWISKMISLFEDDKKIVIGYSPYTGNKILSKFIRFETFMTALQYFGYTLSGIPYMGVGRNMAVEKSFFISSGGYKSHFDLASGNDDLFINENATKKNIAIQLDPDTFVYTDPPKTLASFIKQKTRHISTSFKYKFFHQLLLGLYSFSHIGFYLLLIISLFFFPVFNIIVIWIIRLLVIYLSSFRAFKKLKEQELLAILPVLDFLMFLYYVVIGIIYLFTPKNKWD